MATEQYLVDFWRGRITDKPQDGPGGPDCGFDELNRWHDTIFGELDINYARVLDAGCGVGRLASRFTDYTGVDFVPEFIETARGLHPDKTFHVADFNNKLPFPDKYFDWVITVSSMQYCKTNELRRVGKRVLELSYSHPNEYKVIL